ncbi:hypothetical protein [Borreliella valaisiana]|uniref:hypothetical protein n=1 Tax=Borreliella valaisiana TaxID=62088 RepID=UPI002ED313BA|nr:hypothetical protein KJD09_05300 [Borreliella valaisiana]
MTEGIKKLGSEVSSKVKEELMQADGQPQGQVEEQVFQGADEDLKLKEEIEKNKRIRRGSKGICKVKRTGLIYNRVTQGDQAKGKGIVGAQAWSKAKKLGLNGNYSTNSGTDSNDFAKKVMGDSLKRIDEEPNNSIEDGGEV